VIEDALESVCPRKLGCHTRSFLVVGVFADDGDAALTRFQIVVLVVWLVVFRLIARVVILIEINLFTTVRFSDCVRVIGSDWRHDALPGWEQDVMVCALWPVLYTWIQRKP